MKNFFYFNLLFLKKVFSFLMIFRVDWVDLGNMSGDVGDWVVGRIIVKVKEFNFDVEDYEKFL